MSWRISVLYCLYFLLLVGSSIFFSIDLVSAQSISDDEWMKQRLIRIHARYTAAGDHDQFLYKLQQAQQNTTSLSVRNTLQQIEVMWEELRPTVVRGGVSSIPPSFITQIVTTKKKEVNTEAQKDEEKISNSDEGVVGKGPILEEENIVSHDRYQLANGYIDVGVLQTTRLGRVNELRVSRGRYLLKLHPLLDKTAADRSETMRHKGVGDHRRFANSAYYSYGEIEQRFTDKGVRFVNVSRATFTENIGWSTFRCSQEDCTQIAIDAMRTTFNFYLREEGTKNDAHRRTMIHPLFQIVGLGISVDESAGKFYLTTHYGTEIK